MPQTTDLNVRVAELEKKVQLLSRDVSYGRLPSMLRIDKNLVVTTGLRLRLEPTPEVGTVSGTINSSNYGEFLGISVENTSSSIIGTDLYYSAASGVWIPVGNSTPLVVTLAGNSNNQSIETPANVVANYILLNNTSGGSVNLTGIQVTLSSTGVIVPGTEIVLLNISTQNVVIKYDTTSTAANRFFTISGADVTLAQHQSIRLRYRASITNYLTETRTGWCETN